MLANVMVALLLAILLYGAYLIFRPVDDTDARQARWRRLLLQPHLESGATATGNASAMQDDALDDSAAEQRPEQSSERRKGSGADARDDAAAATRAYAPPEARAIGEISVATDIASTPASTAWTAPSRDLTRAPPIEPGRTPMGLLSERPSPVEPPGSTDAGLRDVTPIDRTVEVVDALDVTGADAAAPAIDMGASEEGDRERTRLAALEREVEALREVTRRTERLEAELAVLAAGAVSEGATAAHPAAAQHPDEGLDYPALRAEIDTAPLDGIARRRLVSELETWQRRGGDDDGLVRRIRRDVAAARTHGASLFESERPRDEAERLRADLSLRERQILELRARLEEMERERDTEPARTRHRDSFGRLVGRPLSAAYGPNARLADPFDRVPRREDLKIVKGIGRRMERMLNDLGVTTLAQLAAFEQRHIDRVARQLEGTGDDIVAENWVGQARAILARRRERYEID